MPRNIRRVFAVPPTASNMSLPPALVLIGPTAIGKTALSLDLARRFNCEIISMDSMQVYRGMDIGTAKATPEERALVPHHLLDIADPDEQYSAARFVTDCGAAMADIHRRGKLPLITGGTGLYLRALNQGLFASPDIPKDIRDNLKKRLESEGRAVLFRELERLDPKTAARIHPNDTQRLLRGLEVYHSTGLPWSEHLARQRDTGRAGAGPLLMLGLRCEREVLRERISRRTLVMMREPFRQEVAGLLAQGYGADLPSLCSLGYRHMIRHITGVWTLAEATETLITDTRRYAKRQLTWFRAEPDIHWLDRDEDAPSEALFHAACALIERFLQGRADNGQRGV